MTEVKIGQTPSHPKLRQSSCSSIKNNIGTSKFQKLHCSINVVIHDHFFIGLIVLIFPLKILNKLRIKSGYLRDPTTLMRAFGSGSHYPWTTSIYNGETTLRQKSRHFERLTIQRVTRWTIGKPKYGYSLNVFKRHNIIILEINS